MKTKQFYCILALFCLNSSIIHAQQDFEKAVISTFKIKDHIHMLQWSGAGNMMLLSGKDGNILIDDQFAPLSEKINAAIQAVSPGQVKFLFNTHYHGDHAGGNANFANKGAIIFAHENVRTRLNADSTKLKFTKLTKPEPVAALPVITYSEGMNLYLNNEYVMIFHVDNAHTDGDAVFYLPQSNVLHTGDCFMKGKFPFIDRNSGGSVNGWLSAVSRILTIIDDETIIMPGHGDLANKKDYRAVRDAVMSLRDDVKKNIKAGQNIDKILAMNLSKDYDTTFGSGFIKGDALIKTIYAELSSLK
jgi:cyclase